MKVRQNLYIDHKLVDELGALARAPGGNKSRLVNQAVVEWLARRGTREVDALFGQRLDKLSRDNVVIRRDLEVLIESVSQFILHQLTAAAHMPEPNKTSKAVGRDRFDRFISEVGRQIATARKRPPVLVEASA